MRQPHLAAWTARLRHPVPPAATHAAHPRLALLAFLAAAAGLVRHAALTADAWLWLALEPPARLDRLWAAWLAAPPDLRHAYHVPAADLPPPWPRLLIEALPEPGAPFTPLDLADRILGRHPRLTPYFQAHFPDLAAVDRAVAAILGQPLVSFGVVAPAAGDHYVVLPFPPAAPTPTAPTPATVIPVDPAGLDIAVPDTAPPAAEARLARFSRYLRAERGAAGLTRLYRLTPATVARAAAADEGLPDLLAACADLGAAPAPALAADLAAWWRDGRRLELGPAGLLRAATPALMAELFADHALAPVLGELLAPTVCLLRVPLAEARHALAATGRPAALLAPAPDAPPETPPGHDDLALWLAGILYRSLGRHLPLPFPFRADQLTAAWARLSPDQQLAAAQAADTLLAQLTDLLDGVSYAPPEAPTDPAAWRAALEQAAAAHATIQLTYHGAGRNLLTRRLIEPYWIEPRAGIPYLRAYCHATGRVRLFRLDRIRDLTPPPPLSSP